MKLQNYRKVMFFFLINLLLFDFSVNLEYFIKNEKVQVKDEVEHCKIVQDNKISYLGIKLKQIINSTEILWIYLSLFVLLIIGGYYVSFIFSIKNIIDVDQLKQELKQFKDKFTKDNIFINKSNFNDYRIFTSK